MSDEDFLDPEVLAAIEASKSDIQDLEDDPMVRAALEESMREAEAENKVDNDQDDDKRDNGQVDDNDEVDNDQDRNDQDNTDQDDRHEESLTNGNAEPHSPATTSPEPEKHAEQNSTPEEENNDKDRDENDDKDPLPDEDPLPTENGHDVSEENSETVNGSGNVDDENNLDNDEASKSENDNKEGEIELEGEPVTDENPLNSEANNSSDPLTDAAAENGDNNVDEGGADNNTENDDNPQGNILEVEFPVKRENVKSEPSDEPSSSKRKRSSSRSDDEESKKALRPRITKSSKDILYRCPFCTFSCEVLGELNIHIYKEHEKQQKPSYLDLAEVIIAKFDLLTGGRREVVFQNMEANYPEYLLEDKKQSQQMFNRAVEGGIQLGRIRKGGKGNAFLYMVGKEKRKSVFDRWKMNKRSVEYKDVKSIVEGSKEFLEIQATLKKLNSMVGVGPRKKKDDSDDDICVVEEKITDKARRRAIHRKRLIEQKKKQLAQQRAMAMKKGGPKTVIKVNSVQGKQLLRKIASSGTIPSSVAKSGAKKTTLSKFDDDDEENLTCPVCMSSFWYPNQTLEHLKTVHKQENPEKYLKERLKSKRK